MIKKIIKKYFESFVYFYSYLGYRIFIVMIFSILIGILDGFGLTMFLPLLQMVDSSSSVESESLGKLQFLIDIITNTGISLTLLSVLIFMSLFFLFKGVIQYISGIYKVNVQEWFVKNIRFKNVMGLNSLGYKYFVKSDVGRIQNTITGEVDRVATSYVNYFAAIEYGILVIVYMGFAFTIDPQFAVLVTIGGLVTNFFYTKLYENTRGISKNLTGENSLFQGLIIQNVANFKYLKATGYLNRYSTKLKESILRIRDSNKKIGKLDALLTAAREPILIIVVVAVIYIQTSFFGSELGPILISLLFFYRALGYLMQMQFRWNKFLAFSGSLENLKLFGQELAANKEVHGDIDLNDSINEMVLDKIILKYDNSIILNNISVKIKKNQTIAFVGESGSGKTSLINILAGLLPIDAGSYRINGIDSRKINMDSTQKKIGYITQDPVIFNDSVYNNITFWAEQNSENLKRFWKVARQAAIFDFITSLPEKENGNLGNHGINLSGGQRQRISIARELFKDVEILILDEATSALDSETQKEIQNNIDQLKGNYTILVVAHNISTIKNADSIVVMKAGKILEIDNFSDLMEKSVYFKRLVELQAVGQI